MTSTKQLIHFTDYPGAEPTILFIHGFTCDETDWANQVKHFGIVGQRVITVDLPGHGKSLFHNTNDLTMKAISSDVVTLLHHLRVASAVVVGHSMGTIIAAEIAIQAPDMVVGIALIDGSRIASKGDPEEAVARSNARFEHIGFKRSIQDKFERMFLPGSDEEEKNRIINRACAQPEGTSIAIVSSAIRWFAADFEYKYSHLKVPVQVVQSTHRGEGNKRVPVTDNMHIEWHHELNALGVDAEFDLVPGCGHFTMLDKPEVVNSNIERLLERIEAAAAHHSFVSAQ